MSTQLKHRRGTTAQHSTFTGASGEITIDTSKNTVVVHDGSTAGGYPLAKSSDLSTLATDSAVVHLAGNETIAGTKTFSSVISGDISGNAGTVTNGVVTTGSYADPSWITSLSGSKLTGTVVATNGVVTTGSYANPSWISSLAETKVLPSQTSNSGKYLTTNGTSTSWATVDALPLQTGNSGKYLTTNGTVASWATLNVDPNTTTKGLYEHANTINVAYSIASGNNAMSAGPVTLGTSGSVTVPNGSVWTIV